MTTKKLTDREVAKIIERHEKWLGEQRGGKEADFTNAIFPPDIVIENRDLSGANFKNAVFTNATFRNCTLTKCVFTLTKM